MKRHIQTILGDPERGDGHNAAGRPGDCWRTAIACITDADSPEDVPHFVEQDEDGHGNWYLLTLDWLMHKFGETTRIPWVDSLDKITDPPEYMIACGPSPRGNFDHVVVIDSEGNLVHDPHPSQAGLTATEQIFRIEEKK